jgi:hypothetical protein
MQKKSKTIHISNFSFKSVALGKKEAIEEIGEKKEENVLKKKRKEKL